MLTCIGLEILFAVGSVALWVWMLIDAVKRENYKKEDERTTWILIIALTGAIGAVIYYFAVKRKYDKETIIVE